MPRAQYNNEVQYSANLEMERLLNDAARNVRDMLERNRAALDAIVSALTRRENGSLTGEVGSELVHVSVARACMPGTEIPAACMLSCA